jgi:hypothetical protein
MGLVGCQSIRGTYDDDEDFWTKDGGRSRGRDS